MGYGSISPEVAQEGFRAGGIRCGSGAVFNRRRPTACTLLGAYVMVRTRGESSIDDRRAGAGV